MADWRGKAAVVVGVVGLAAGGLHAITPDTRQPTPPAQQVQRDLETLSDANERSTDRMREQGMDGVDAENRERLVSGQTPPNRPDGPRLRIR